MPLPSLPKKNARALLLFSGGLDSQLAALLLREQGIEVHALIFFSPFFESIKGETAARQLGLPLIVDDFTEAIISLLRKPPHGFGAGLNPCIDCHIAMIRRAGVIMRKQQFDFIATGEVLNQRPMSQNRAALDLIARESGLADRLLRPLSARLLPWPESIPEQLVERSRLPALEGRSRKPQIALAAGLGLKDYPQPAGGCRLTEPLFSRKLLDLLDHEGLADTTLIRRINLGRHFRLPESKPTDSQRTIRLIVGRNHAENIKLEKQVRQGEILILPREIPGATGLLAAGADAMACNLAASICARYSDCIPSQPIRMTLIKDTERQIDVVPADNTTINALRIPAEQ